MHSVKPSWKNWQLLTEQGRHIWAFKPTSTDINQHLQNAHNISAQEISLAVEDFKFDKQVNPNSGDKVFRFAAVANNFRSFTGVTPQTNNPEQQKVADSVIKGINYFASLQCADGHWAGDYGGPLFLLPGLLIASYVTHTPFPKAHQEMMKLYVFNHQNADAGCEIV